jgi:hypothetical protein
MLLHMLLHMMFMCMVLVCKCVHGPFARVEMGLVHVCVEQKRSGRRARTWLCIKSMRAELSIMSRNL